MAFVTLKIIELVLGCCVVNGECPRNWERAGITEGFHRKMKLIQRRAYGFRNFENYRTRVRVLCC
ncbi:transposase [Legionella cincinnatiensis]|uniref:transposase n=1 Tax=Legionella cincinnatiensis TaxID=28085 RepID=UPI0009F96F19